ncbi:protein with TPR repeat [Enterocytozoon bieneusi H348]|nr:protein with TPR repeat [Enterocytozoon bieneusi H348]|eukprot:XP_001827878.1 protein with TPR repeat [Enterocytozoon bieneusi H348]
MLINEKKKYLSTKKTIFFDCNVKKTKMTQSNEAIRYLVDLDINMINSDSVESIFTEIAGKETEICQNEAIISVLQKCFQYATSSRCIHFLNTFNLKKDIYVYSCSKIIESILLRLFDYLYISLDKDKNNDIILTKVLTMFNQIRFDHMINNENSTHIFRKLLCLFTGKLIIKNDILIYTHPNTKYIKEIKQKFNREYKFRHESRVHVYITLGWYLQITQSQTFITKAINWLRNNNGDLLNFIKGKGMFYETILDLANEDNNNKLVMIFKDNLKLISEQEDYLIQKILKKAKINLFKILFNEIYTNPEDVSSDIFNSNLFIAGLMNLQNVNEWDIIDQIISKYVQGKSVFYVFLLNKFNNIGEIDSKYVSFICNQMASTICNDKISSAQTITLDFEKYFNKKWINTKSGKNLLMGYLNANISNSQKALFFNTNIKYFYNIKHWKDQRRFMTQLLKIADNKTKYKIIHILKTIL